MRVVLFSTLCCYLYQACSEWKVAMAAAVEGGVMANGWRRMLEAGEL